jgi:hypothetical protein
VHDRNTGATLELNATGVSGAGSRAGSRSRDAGSVEAWAVLATLTAVRGGVTTVAVHGAAASLGPVTADGVAELGSAAAIRGGNASGLGSGGSRGLTKNWFAGGGGGRRAAADRSGVGLVGLTGSSSLASVLASVGREAVAVGSTAVSVRRAAAAESTVGITCGAAKVLSAPAISPGLSSTRRGGLGGLGCRLSSTVVTAREAALSAVSSGASTPAVLRAACAGVDGAVGVAEEVAVSRTALSVRRVLGSLPLGGNDTEG